MKTKNSRTPNSNLAFMEFNTTFLEVAETFAPLKQIKKEDSQPKWYNKKLKNSRTKRNRLHMQSKLDKTNNSLQKFKLCRRALEFEVKQTKRKFYLNKCRACIGNSRQTHKLLDDLTGKFKSGTSISMLSFCFVDNVVNPTQEQMQTFSIVILQKIGKKNK